MGKMLGFLKGFGGKNKAKKSKVQDCVFTDHELDKIKPTANSVKQKKRVKFESETLLHKEGNENGFDPKCDKQGVQRRVSTRTPEKPNSAQHNIAINGYITDNGRLQVKILMKKEEAAQLLSKCKAGRFLEFKDVAQELIKVPSHRVSVMSPSNNSDCLLQSIAEE